MPYIVLHELDDAKIKTNSTKIKRDARLTIHRVNELFAIDGRIFKCQGAIKHDQYLITIQNNDDHVINFGLQVYEHIKNVIIVSNDINVRNKANSNGLQACSGCTIKQYLDGLFVL